MKGESMFHEFSRTEALLGREALEKLKSSKVAVFGVGGVGSHAAEAIARCGVGAIELFDNDSVNITNINRQIIALHSTLGRAKVEVMRDRIFDINPDCRVGAHEVFFTAQNAQEIRLEGCDYIIDAIDTISSKLTLIERAVELNIPIISSMGTGNKLDPSGFIVADIYETSVCPLARVMRRELKARGIKSLKVVYSKEQPIKPIKEELSGPGSTDGYQEPLRKLPPASISFVPPVAGYIMAAEVVKDLLD